MDKFKDINFRVESRAIITICAKITDDYLDNGLRLTLRQLYYQLISLDLLPEKWRDPITHSKNNEKSYGKLSSLISDARLAGLIKWEAIEDRTRIPRIPSEFENLGELIKAAESSYRLPRWKDQPEYIELWVEKEALYGVLLPIARKYHITLVANKGYSSQTTMYESANRFINKGNSKPKTILYIGDFDPSGEDMVRDIQDRMDMFCVTNLEVKKIALTLDQIQLYNPPPNPAKISDPRAQEFIAKFGASSWEVDAINPQELQKIVITDVEAFIDFKLWNKVLKQETKDITKLRKAIVL